MQKRNEVNILTKECIVTALLRLMQTQSYDSISITDITNLAGVSRMAYYRNYSSNGITYHCNTSLYILSSNTQVTAY